MAATSSAYNLSSFETAPKRQAAPEIRVVKNHRRTLSSLFSPRAFSAFAVVVTLISIMVYNQVQLTELTGQINDLSKEMDILHSEDVKMTSALESAISLPSIAEQAKALGMQRRDEYQTKRIYLYQQDKIERTEDAPAPSAGADLRAAATTFIGRIKEYLAG